MNASILASYDSLETRDPAHREAEQNTALPALITHAQRHSVAFAKILEGVDATAITSREALARLPVTRKYELLERQQAGRAKDPFGGFSTVCFGSRMPRVFASPGTLYEPEGTGPDYWRMARAMFAAGFRPGELIHNCFSYHFVPAGAMMEAGAHALGCTVFPGGTGNTAQQVIAMADLKPSAYIGTPSFLKLILDKASEMGITLPSITKAVFGGEAYPPSLHRWYIERGIIGYQFYGTADLGLVAYETDAREGMVLDEGVIVEIVRPGTGDPVPAGEVGELVVTPLNLTYPLIRFGTGDLSAFVLGTCPTGRTGQRIKGWMGRADQSAKVHGMFVHPSQVSDIMRRFPQAQKARLVVSGEMANDQICLKVEADDAHGNLRVLMQTALRDVTKLRGEVEVVPLNSLPNDGKVIDDTRMLAPTEN